MKAYQGLIVTFVNEAEETCPAIVFRAGENGDVELKAFGTYDRVLKHVPFGPTIPKNRYHWKFIETPSEDP